MARNFYFELFYWFYNFTVDALEEFFWIVDSGIKIESLLSQYLRPNLPQKSLEQLCGSVANRKCLVYELNHTKHNIIRKLEYLKVT